jgi:DNA primase
MKISEAKKIQIIDFLNVTGEIGREIWIKSPFNPDEKTASFKIETVKNFWYDHAQKIGGDLIKLVMLLNSCDTAQALKKLDSQDHSFSFSPVSSTTNKPQANIEVEKVQSLQTYSLIQYLKTRKISLEVAQKYLEEIHYWQDYKKYYSLAFKNKKGNYETRNKFFKGCVGRKDFTFINGDNQSISIFEGFFDFLSALEHFGNFKGDVIILNSVAFKNDVAEFLYSKPYKKIYLFLDNDKAGNEAKQFFYSKYNNCIDCSNIYKNHKDFNEFLLTTK